jgi:hypothetical protein
MMPPVAPLVIAAVVAVFAAPPSPAATDARRVMKEGYQDKLPLGDEAEGVTAPGESGRKRTMDPRLRSRRAGAPSIRVRDRDRETRGGAPVGLGMVAQALLWGLMALAVGLCIFWLARELTGYAGEAPAEGEPDEDGPRTRDGPDRAVVERPLGDADELARQGRFGEAIHVLLLRTLQELARRLPERLPSSLTSREIVERVRMPDDARGALSVLVGAVEVSHFGAATPGPGEFQQCRHYFQTFAEAYMRGHA